MEMKILKILAAEFTGDDGKVIQGIYVYMVSVPKSGVNPETKRIFLSDDKVSAWDYSPKVGDPVYVFYNAFGRVVDMVKI